MSQTTQLQRIAQGREAEIFDWEDGRVLRLLRRPDGMQKLQWEATAMEAARAAGVPVPAVFGLTTEMGRSGMIMERVDGPDLLTVFGRKPWWIWQGSRLCGELHAKVNGVEAPAMLPSLRDHVRAKIERAAPPDIAGIALALLDGLPDGDRLCHGDYHPGNVLVGAGGPVIIDWPNVSRGDPDADFARTVLLGKLGEPPPGTSFLVREGARFGRSLFRRAYVNAYTRHRPVDQEAVRRWEVVRAADRIAEGIESERAALEAMVRAAGRW